MARRAVRDVRLLAAPCLRFGVTPSQTVLVCAAAIDKATSAVARPQSAGSPLIRGRCNFGHSRVASRVFMNSARCPFHMAARVNSVAVRIGPRREHHVPGMRNLRDGRLEHPQLRRIERVVSEVDRERRALILLRSFDGS